MATVFIQKRKREKRNSYVVYYKNPATLTLKYFKTYMRQKDAKTAANDLRSLLDTGKAPAGKKNKITFNFLTFGEVSDLLKVDWDTRLQNGSLRKKTYENYLYIVNHLKKIFGKFHLCEISENDIRINLFKNTL
jgi:hypothetical protein